VVFKPIWVDAQVPTHKENPDPNSHKGFWIDGGLLNNLPIHAFDRVGATASSSSDPDLYPLNARTLGIRLTPGYKDSLNNVAEAQEETPNVFDYLREYMVALRDTLLYPSEQGQIRTPSEKDQTIELFTDTLELLDFAPPEEKRAKPIMQAEEDVLGYFHLPPFRYPT
jgi:hypothetical protein